MDHASATDLRGRIQWEAVLQAASRCKIDLVLVWKLDRAFRGTRICSFPDPVVERTTWSEQRWSSHSAGPRAVKGILPHEAPREILEPLYGGELSWDFGLDSEVPGIEPISP